MGETNSEVKSRLAALLAKQQERVARDRRADPFAASLVRLHRGGPKRPFYCVHPGSGAVGCFTEIAALVDPDRPFFALQAPGIDGTCEPVKDLSELARGYVAEVRREQPHGPYMIGGWSLGGMIAFEMAHVLRAAGEEVSLLALFDTQRFEAIHKARMSRPEAIQIMNYQGGYGVAHLARQRGVELDVHAATARFGREQPKTTPARLELMLQILVEAGVFTDATHPMFRVFRANMLAIAEHGLPDTIYDGEITLFRCSNLQFGDLYARIDETYCWSRATSLPVRVIPMATHHFALFHGEVMLETARHLRSCLDRADAMGGRA